MDEIRLALIGMGAVMSGHLRSLVHIDGLRIVGMADPDEARLASAAEKLEYEAPCFTDYRALLDEVAADACVIAVPNYLHGQVACDCLDAGLHALCEKPMATSAADCDAMIAAARRAGRILQVGLCCRFSRVDSKVHELLASGVIEEQYPAARRSCADDLEASLAHLRLPVPHRQYARTTNLIGRIRPWAIALRRRFVMRPAPPPTGGASSTR